MKRNTIFIIYSKLPGQKYLFHLHPQFFHNSSFFTPVDDTILYLWDFKLQTQEQFWFIIYLKGLYATPIPLPPLLVGDPRTLESDGQV